MQVFYLDNLDLGPLSKTKDHLPRISLFDYESIKKMIEVITSNVDGDTSFAGASVRPLPFKFAYRQYVLSQNDRIVFGSVAEYMQ